MKKNTNEQYKVISENRKARFNYELLNTYEAGIVLIGSEVKSLRVNGCSIAESYIAYNGTTLEIINMLIPSYKNANNFAHEEKRKRDLLLHKKEIKKCKEALEKKGLTAVPLVIYFNHKGLVKIKFSIARGKNLVDKRKSVAEREWKIDQKRILKNL